MHRFVIVLPFIAQLAGCTVGGVLPSGGSGSSGPFDRPTRPGDLVLRVSVEGGFAPAAARLTELPTFSLLGDGRVIRPGPQIAIYPSPLLPNLQQSTLTMRQVDDLLAEAAAAGVFGPDADYPVGGVMDASTTVFTSNVNGHHRISAYALGEAGDEGLTDETRTARSKLRGFLSALPDAGPTTSYTAAEVRLLVHRHDPARDDATTGGLRRGTIDWPLPNVSLARAGHGAQPLPDWRCFTVTGEDAGTFLVAARGANALTLWREAGEAYMLLVRPLLPDETGCPAGA
ncbi:MAG TPA: hypothetical protein VFI28_04670 [Candidatus Limnocylindrales bacterium]|nr:hypothetical protein [Candidatus Limnocylindrales bacterium]